VGIAVLLLVAAVTTGVPHHGTPVPAVPWSLAAVISLAGAATFILWGRRTDAVPASQSSVQFGAECR
jgi:hypothetical protein